MIRSALCCSAWIQVLVDAIRKKCPNLALNCWYLDDGIIAGSAKDVREALHILQTLGPELGMDLNLTKNEQLHAIHHGPPASVSDTRWKPCRTSATRRCFNS